QLSEEAFIQVGDFVGVGLKHAARRSFQRVTIIGMMGKLSKMAAGKMMTHAAGSEVDMTLLAGFAAELGATEDLRNQILAANTARHVLELAAAADLVGITSLVCQRVTLHATRHAGGALEVRALLVDFNGTLLGSHPEGAMGTKGSAHE